MMKNSGLKRRSVLLVAGLCLALTFSAAPTKKADACVRLGADCWIYTAATNWWATNPGLSPFMTAWLQNVWFQNNILVNFWQGNVRPALMQMTGQLVAARVDMTGMIGGFFDARQTLQTQLTLQRLHAEAIRDYTPGENLCRIGTGVRSLALSEEKASTNAIALAEIAQSRQMGTRGGSADMGPLMDQQARFRQFRYIYCDPADNGGLTAALCNVGANPTGDPTRFNKDINFTRTVGSQPTLDLDFSNGQLTANEEDVIALGNNLYSHDVFQRMNDILFSEAAGNAVNRLKFLDLRQIVATRSVAQNAYNTIVAKRARGAAGSAQFLRNVLREMGMSEEEARRYIGGATAAGSNANTVGAANGEPSYHAQMEILTSKLYQNPNFYINLVDKPAEIARVQTAMKAIQSMNDNDYRKTQEDQEMLLSLLLEMKIRKEQADVDRNLHMLNQTRH